MNLLAELRRRFQQALDHLVDDSDVYTSMVRPAQDARFGDYQANCAMPLGKILGRNPRDVAESLVASLKVDDLCEPPEVAGPGFINLKLHQEWLAAETARLVDDPRLGHQAVEDPLHYVIDFSSPNVAKPMHVGHLRSTVIGDALVRVLGFQGQRVTGDNHVGDWGTQFGMIIQGYRQFLDADAYAEDAVGELARLYRLVSRIAGYHETSAALPGQRSRWQERQAELGRLEEMIAEGDKSRKSAAKKLRAEVAGLAETIEAAEVELAAVETDEHLARLADQHPEIAEASRAETAKLHAGDPENRALWEEFLPSCLEAMDAIYRRLDVEFAERLGESYYQPMLADVVESLEQRELARTSEGAVCVFIEGNDAPFIVRKSDGAFTYATTDLATIRHRVEQQQADVILYVVDARQGEHFRLLFDTARLWGFAETEFTHVSFGTVLGEDRRPFKTRSGDTVGLESLLDEAVVRARRIVDENDDAKPEGPELDEATRAAVAEAVGIGGIKYADLHHNRDSDYQFSWDKMLATNGDTATYMQYAHARILGIFRRGEVDRETLRQGGPLIVLGDEVERALAMALNRFADAIDVTATECRPNVLTQYLFETANAFSTFYNACPVLKEPDAGRRDSRLALCDLTARVLARGLSLLGIDVCEQM
ncbi:MAG: arginine--tRNA ligase [Planctomycetaceae bacterium]|nr:arginine--tRNA ligase [Planctomycetaceae bacterium]